MLLTFISIQVFLVSLCLLSKCWDGSPVSKLSLHASHLALPKYILVSERLHVCCIRVINLCHRVPTQLQLNKYYYYYYYLYPGLPTSSVLSVSFVPKVARAIHSSPPATQTTDCVDTVRHRKKRVTDSSGIKKYIQPYVIHSAEC